MELLASALGLAGLLVAQFSMLWCRLGRLEGKIEEHCRQSDGSKEE